MGSQTLEILRQGVWASLTGGWFYDPHQDVFCNTFHLYIWLFLLCLPFSIYVYFPPTKYVWYFYCGSVTVVLTVVKLVNYGLHHMYDNTDCIQEQMDHNWPDHQTEKREEEGIEMQILSNKLPSQTTRPILNSLHTFSETVAQPSTDADSLESTEFQQLDISEGRRNQNSTIGSLELGYIDKNPNQVLASEGFYFKPNTRGGVRRIRSTALETCCPPPPLTAHPNSLEVIGCKSARNPLPPPSINLTRNQHLNLCPYYGSEIVYPIAEQSDEHQTSHGPDTDIDSLTHVSDSDLEENNQGSHSPLIYIKLKKLKNVPYNEKYQTKMSPKFIDEERTSATSKDALLDNDNSNSSVTPDMHDSRTDCYGTDNDVSDKKLSECSNLSCSNTSVECEERTSDKHVRSHIKFKPNDKCIIKKLCDSEVCDAKAEVNCNVFIRKRHIKKNKRRKYINKNEDVASGGNFSSLVELDLDWLFNDESHRLQHRKEPLKKELEWSSTTTVSLEHDVSKVLQETVPVARSLGAIPKKAIVSCYNEPSSRKTPKSESEKCSICRCKPNIQSENRHRNKSTKENKVTQTLRQSESSSPEGLECIVYSSSKISKANGSKKGSNVKVARMRNDEASSSGSNNELSTLLPPAPLLSAFLNSRRDYPLSVCMAGEGIRFETSSPHRNRLKRNRVNRRRSSNMVRKDQAIASTLSAGYGTHSAKNFNDTSNGSVHCYMDEHGNLITYTFDENGLGTANSHIDSGVSEKMSVQGPQGDSTLTSTNKNIDFWDSTESIYNSSVSTMPVISVHKSKAYTNPNSSNIHAVQVVRMRRKHASEVRMRLDQAMDQMHIADDWQIDMVGQENETEESTARNRFKFIQATDTVNNNYPQIKSYYNFKLLPWTFIKVTLDRLKLLALLDRNLTIWETILSVILGVLVSVLGAVLLYSEFYKDLLAFIICFIIASCQYSLIKSVQPDAASPTHGFNRVIAYSRPVYFCIFAIIILILDNNIAQSTKEQDYNLNNYNFSREQILLIIRDFVIKFIILFPVLFSLGLFPQINTFIMYLLEQIDMHIFGGNAMSSLTASFYCIFRSLLAVIMLNGLAYGGLCESKRSQHVLFSIFCACLVACSYHLSRSASDPLHIWNIVKSHLWLPDIYREQKIINSEPQRVSAEVYVKEKTGKYTIKYERTTKERMVKFPTEVKDLSEEHIDPLPHKLQKTVNERLKNDVIVCPLIAVLVFGIHASTVFTVLQPELSPVLWSMAATIGFVLHYIVPELRKHLPWLCIARPIFRSHEHEQYQIRGPAKIMWFERIYIYFCFFERNILYPLLFLSVLTEDSPELIEKYGVLSGSIITVICGLKCLRSSYCDQSSQYLILIFTALFFKYDYNFPQETFLVKYFFMSIAFHKFYELLLKVQFVITYIAPWQITWGSAFHAFAQPFSVPHSAMLFLQAFISAILSTPLNPFLGSAIFLTSYVRPVKFWERDYNTRRVDHSNTPLSSHLDRNLGADDNNLNSIFYEHLTRSLQHSLCGDLKLGRWGPVNQGDCFVLASDYLNCLVHIIEMGNDLVTFQMRGLEFRGTYCQQREVEAITEGVDENDGCCCCDTGKLPNMLSINSAFSQRWLAWEVTAAKYILEGYSISDNSAVSMLQVFEFRKVLVSYYVKSIIFYTIKSSKLEEWLSNQIILKALRPMEHRNFVDLDPIFNYNIDEDFDVQSSGMTRSMFVQIHGEWITYCVDKSEKNIESGINSSLVLLCFALSLLGRRTLGAVSHNTVSSVEFFLYGLHALFKGDFRITCSRDEWVFTDMDLLKTIVAPGVRMSLKLHQDHFMSPDEYEELPALYDAICKHEEELVISHEGDPAWRSAVLSGMPSLLALRHVLDDGTDEYKIIMLNKRYLSFRVIKVNKECVRGLWAGQQQELVYLRNRNPERGSIQNAKQALRNIINSSCDQPIGYPIYVSPLTISYAESNEQYCSLIGGSISLTKIRSYIFNLFRRIRKRCGEGCSSGAANREEIGMGHEGVYAMTPISTVAFHTTGSQSTDGSHLGSSIGRGSSMSRASLGCNRGSLVSMGKPTSSTLASLAGLFRERDDRTISQAPDLCARTDERLGDINDTERELVSSRVRIVDPNLVYDAINLGRRIDVSWPTEYMRVRGGRTHWKDWVPEAGMEGPVVHKWIPCHKDPNKRSHVDRTIVLVQIDDKFIPIAESGVQNLGPTV